MSWRRHRDLRPALIGCTARRVKPLIEAAPVSSTTDPIDPLLVELLALFAGPLANVSFPDVDHTTLSALADRVRTAAADVEAARTSLDQREQALEEAQSALLVRGRRALAYARVYAESDEQLRSSLDALGSLQTNARLSGSAKMGARPKRGELSVVAVAAQAAGTSFGGNEQQPPASKRRGRPRKNPVVGGNEAAAESTATEVPDAEVAGTDAAADNDVAAAE